MKLEFNKFGLILAASVACSIHLFAQNTPSLGNTAPAGTVTESHTVPPATAAPGVYNYTRTFVPKIPITDAAQVNESSPASWVQAGTVFKDGFQRGMLYIQHNAAFSAGSSNLNHLVQPIDTRFQPNNDACAYLPYPSNSAQYEVNAFGQQKSYYDALYPGEQSQAFSRIKTESDANSRKSTAYAPGLSHVGQGRGSSNQWITNTASQVRIWKVDANGLPSSNAFYPAGTLTGDLTTDASGAEVVGFTDKAGRLIVKTVLLHTVTTGDGVAKIYGSTYYVYNDLGQLSYVFPPKASDLLAGGGTASQSVLDNLCYQYKYDKRGLKIEQKLPGKAIEYFVYDLKNRLVLYQDGNLRAAGENWTFIAYDALDRPLFTGVYFTTNESRTVLQNFFFDGNTYPPIYLIHYLKDYTALHKYPTIPVVNTTVLQENYYDDYRISDPNGDLWSSYSNTLQFTELQNVNGAETPSRSLRTRGLVTGHKIRILPSANADPAKVGDWKQDAVFYDEDARPIYTVGKDFYQNNTIHESYAGTQYDFSGKVLTTKHIVRNNNSADGALQHTELVKNEYDPHTDRLTAIRHKVNNGAWTILASYTYDDLGRMKQEILGNGGEVRDYTYNIRGQLTGINGIYAETGNKGGVNRTFGESLKYDYGFTQPKYNGLVSGMVWRGSNVNDKYAYGYSYDRSGRLTQADFRRQFSGFPWENQNMDYSVSNLSYDKNGNIQSMNQRGMQPGAGPVNMDVLSYSYENGGQSNKLQYVNDAGVAPYGAGDFANGNTGNNDYSYDANGNLISDLNKGIAAVQYNIWDKPDVVQLAGGTNWQYSYDGAGNKVQERHFTSSATTVRGYIDNFVYRNDSLQYILTPVGRTTYNPQTATPYKEEYFVKDHLGNVRSTIDVFAYMMQEYLATFEIASANLEGLFFDNLNDVRDSKPESMNPGDQYSARLNGAEPGREIGASLLMHVMAGDHINFNVNNFYEGYDNSIDEPMAVEEILELLVNTLTTGNGGWAGSESHDTKLVDHLFTTENFMALEDIINNTAYDPTKPKAYLNYILFDENMRIVPEMSGAYQANGEGSWTTIGSITPRTIPQNGYLAVFLTNKTRTLNCLACGDVYFDQLKVEVAKSNLLEENHYYPYGLPIQGLSSAASGFKDNKHKYQGNEYTRQGLDWMDFHNRQYDPQLGRFLGIDPLAEQSIRFSPYAGMDDNPVSVTDPLGLKGEFMSHSVFDNPFIPSGGAVATYSGHTLKSQEDMEAFSRDCAAERVRQLMMQQRMQTMEQMLGESGGGGGGTGTVANNDAVGDGSGLNGGDIPGVTVTANANKGKSWFGKLWRKVGSTVLDVVQTGLDVVGLVPGLGEAADLINAGIYALRGDYTNAALSLAATVPFAGWAATGGKWAMKASRAYKAAKGVSKFGDYNLARNAALEWLTARGFNAEKVVVGKFGISKGKPIGMSSMDGKIGFRVEYDARNGAHINVWFGKEKGPHFQFNASEETVNEIIKRFSR